MKLTILLLIATIALLVFSYQQTPQKMLEGQTSAKDLSAMTIDSSQLHPEGSSIDYHSSYKTEDSLQLALALKDAFRIATPNFVAEQFTSAYTLPTTDSADEVDIEIIIGKLLGTSQTYFLLRRFYTGTEEVYLDLYAIQEDSSQLLLHDQQPILTYQKDTFFDVNGDQQQDFVIRWYPSAGSWSRDVYDVYLNTSNNTPFIGPYSFMNPVFAPLDGLIRGRAYGDPADASFYKYQWNGLQLDTLEYIYPHPGEAGKYFRTAQDQMPLQADNGVVLDSLPLEYIGL